MEWKTITKSLWMYEDSCNVYAVKGASGIVVINAEQANGSSALESECLLWESETAENFLRMNSMNQASDAVKEAIEKLEATIRKTRQTTITRELVEIISGAEALKK